MENHRPKFGVQLWRLLEAHKHVEAPWEMVTVLRPYLQLWAEVESDAGGDGYLGRLYMKRVGLDLSRCRPLTRDVRERFHDRARQMLIERRTSFPTDPLIRARAFSARATR